MPHSNFHKNGTRPRSTLASENPPFRTRPVEIDLGRRKALTDQGGCIRATRLGCPMPTSKASAPFFLGRQLPSPPAPVLSSAQL